MGATVFFTGAAELATLTNTFTVAGVPTDPTTVSLTITTPSGVATTYTYGAAQITKTSTGVYTKDIGCTEPGEWQYVWTGTTAASDVIAGTWTVYDNELGHLYATVSALKSRLGITDTSDDQELHAACFAASRAVEQICERTFYKTAAATVRSFEPTGFYLLRLPEYNDLVSVSALKTDISGDGVYENTWQTTDYQLLPANPAGPEVKPFTSIKAVGLQIFPYPIFRLARTDLVQITGVFGWPAVPYMVKQAALIAAAELFKLKDAPFGVAGFGEFGAVRVKENPFVLRYLGPYMRNPVLVA